MANREKAMHLFDGVAVTMNIARNALALLLKLMEFLVESTITKLASQFVEPGINLL